MKKTMKKILCTLLVVVMCLTSVPFAYAVDDGEYQNGDIIEIGSYPQSEVTNRLLISRLNELPLEWISYEYYSGDGTHGSMSAGNWMKYADVEYEGEKYRAVYFEKYRPPHSVNKNPGAGDGAYQYTNGYFVNNIYWFKYEPIEWYVLKADEGLLISKSILDAQYYSNESYLSGGYGTFNSPEFTYLTNDYITSSLCKWLNNSFFNCAFENNKNVTSIDLLIRKEAENLTDTVRGANGTDYAACQGLNSHSLLFESWWLRYTGESVNGHCSYVTNSGCAFSQPVMLQGVRPVISVDFSLNDDTNIPDQGDDTSDIIKPAITVDRKEFFTKQHLNFVKGIYNTLTTDFRFANTLWENMDSVGQNTAEFVHDIIEGTVEVISFKAFDGLESIKNPYDAILLDFLAADTTQSFYQDTVKNDALTVSVGIINDLIKMFDNEYAWAEGFDIEKELQSLLNASDYSGNKLYEGLNTLFLGKGKKEVTAVFQGFDCFGKVLSNLSDGLSAVDCFVEMLRFTAAIEAYYNSSEVYKQILNDIASEMYNVNQKFAEKFNESLGIYAECLSYDTIVNAVLKHGLDNGLSLIQDLTSEMLADATFSLIMKAFKVGGDVAGKINAALWAVNTGFNLSNMLTGNDTLVNCRRLLRANYMLDVASYNIMKIYETTLKNKESYGAALLFDSSFTFFKNVQVYSLDLYKTYCESSSTKLFSFKKGYFRGELQETVSRLNNWKRVKCHDYSEILGMTVFGISNSSATVNIYRKADNSLVGSIVNGKSTIYNDDISAISVSGEISVALPSLEEYTVKVTATQDGSMNLSYAEYEDFNFVNEQAFAGVNATNGKTYTLDTENKTLIRDDGIIYRQDGGIEGCSCNCHASGIKKFFFNFILFFQKIFKINAVCDCGVAHY